MVRRSLTAVDGNCLTPHSVSDKAQNRASPFPAYAGRAIERRPMRIDQIEIRMPTEDEERVAKACLEEHTIETGGVAFQEEPFSVLAVCNNRVIGGLIGRV